MTIDYLLYILLAILMLGILIAVHEFGHFMAARLTCIAVKEFAVGFGPKLIQWHSKKHGTLFAIRPIPLGGYCMFYGDETDPDGVDDPRAFDKAKVWRRALTVFSGPLMNFVLAFVLAVGLMAGYGVAVTQPFLDTVETGMPAENAGLRAGDVLLAVNGEALPIGDAGALIAAIDKLTDGQSLTVTVRRGDVTMDVAVVPVWDAAESRSRIGVGVVGYKPLAAGQVLPAAWDSCVYASTIIIKSLGALVTTSDGFKNAAGPIGVVQMVAEQTQQGGFEVFLNLAVIISINLGLINLLPIPGLDGSRLVFFLIEGIRRKPVSRRVETAVHMTGFALLIGLMVLFTFQDVGRIIGG